MSSENQVAVAPVPVTHFLDLSAVTVHPVARHFADLLVRGRTDDRIADCPHITAGEVSFWIPSAPELLRCAACLDDALREPLGRRSTLCLHCGMEPVDATYVPLSIAVDRVHIILATCGLCAQLGELT